MLPGPDGCLTPGEGGNGAYPVFNYVDDTLLCSYADANESAYGPNPNGSIFVPFESDLSIQNPGDAWFYHKGAYKPDRVTNPRAKPRICTPCMEKQDQARVAQNLEASDATTGRTPPLPPEALLHHVRARCTFHPSWGAIFVALPT